MHRVESGPAMPAMTADHRVSASTFASAIPSTASAPSPILPVSVVSILSLSTLALLSGLVLSGLVLTGPAAGSQMSGGAGLTATDTHDTLGG